MHQGHGVCRWLSWVMRPRGYHGGCSPVPWGETLAARLTNTCCRTEWETRGPSIRHFSHVNLQGPVAYEAAPSLGWHSQPFRWGCMGLLREQQWHLGFLRCGLAHLTGLDRLGSSAPSSKGQILRSLGDCCQGTLASEWAGAGPAEGSQDGFWSCSGITRGPDIWRRPNTWPLGKRGCLQSDVALEVTLEGSRWKSPSQVQLGASTSHQGCLPFLHCLRPPVW